MIARIIFIVCSFLLPMDSATTVDTSGDVSRIVCSCCDEQRESAEQLLEIALPSAGAMPNPTARPDKRLLYATNMCSWGAMHLKLSLIEATRRKNNFEIDMWLVMEGAEFSRLICTHLNKRYGMFHFVQN